MEAADGQRINDALLTWKFKSMRKISNEISWYTKRILYDAVKAKELKWIYLIRRRRLYSTKLNWSWEVLSCGRQTEETREINAVHKNEMRDILSIDKSMNDRFQNFVSPHEEEKKHFFVWVSYPDPHIGHCSTVYYSNYLLLIFHVCCAVVMSKLEIWAICSYFFSIYTVSQCAFYKRTSPYAKYGCRFRRNFIDPFFGSCRTPSSW